MTRRRWSTPERLSPQSRFHPQAAIRVIDSVGLVKTHREFLDRVEQSMRGKDEFGRLWAMLMQNLPPV